MILNEGWNKYNNGIILMSNNILCAVDNIKNLFCWRLNSELEQDFAIEIHVPIDFRK